MIAIIRRQVPLIAGVALFVTLWMLFYTFFMYKPSFSSNAMVIIKDSAVTSRYIEPDQYAMQTTSSNSANPVLNTMGMLKAGSISDALWNFFRSNHPSELAKLHIKNHAQWDNFYQDGSGFIKAKNQPGTDLINIQFSWHNAFIAKESLDTIVKAFQEASRDLNKEEQVSRNQFLNRQVEEIETQLAQIRDQKSAYQSKQHTVSVQREEQDLAATRMDLANHLNLLESQAEGKKDLAQRYQKLLGLTPEIALEAAALGQNSSMSHLQDELYHLQQMHALLTSTLTETNPKVQEIQTQIDQVKADIISEKLRTLGETAEQSRRRMNSTMIADTVRSTMVSNMIQAQGDAQDLKAQAQILGQRLNEVDGSIKKFPVMAEGLANIEQKETSLSTALDQLREKVLEGRLKEEQTLSNVFIVDPARLPEKAQFPNRKHLVVLSVVLGLAAGLAAAFVREQFPGNSNGSNGSSYEEWQAEENWRRRSQGIETNSDLAASHPYHSELNFSQLEPEPEGIELAQPEYLRKDFADAHARQNSANGNTPKNDYPERSAETHIVEETVEAAVVSAAISHIEELHHSSAHMTHNPINSYIEENNADQPAEIAPAQASEEIVDATPEVAYIPEKRLKTSMSVKIGNFAKAAPNTVQRLEANYKTSEDTPTIPEIPTTPIVTLATTPTPVTTASTNTTKVVKKAPYVDPAIMARLQNRSPFSAKGPVSYANVPTMYATKPVFTSTDYSQN